ncbi:MAG: hypothetical protein IKZ47_03040 [Clostridia bacterium]|nr:hypothetical protein [Clostridia bacterium]
MKTIFVADTTLNRSKVFGFKESIEIARQLEKLKVDIIELPKIASEAKDVLLIKTIASSVKSTVLSVEGGTSEGEIDLVAAALASAKCPRIRISLPVSDVGMEYGFHKKGPAMTKLAGELVKYAAAKCGDIEFCALDATRADIKTLTDILNAAVDAGAKAVTLYDNEGMLFPDEMADFVSNVRTGVQGVDGILFGICCSDATGMAAASSFAVLRKGADIVKTCVGGDITGLMTAIEIFRTSKFHAGLTTNIDFTSSNTILSRIEWIISGDKDENEADTKADAGEISLDVDDDIDAVRAAALKIGYDLSDEDIKKVYSEFKRIANKKNVSLKEMEAIIASTALQVEPVYTLDQYSIQSGNVMTSSAQINMIKDGVTYTGISVGDGPIDAAFRTIEQITGRHFELDDFQIQSITEGHEAMGSALVKLRSGGKLYSGKGLSTDIIGASIRAYISALNKILYEEA